ncbi:hypothetical protein COO60DRAFT_666116 [Scenedesmus sp. NREL 46B-D3]|nr:hypothetical protein COO60DRAFT_666116 [Scenedesmus sp. NREL 46B-D3]
MLGCRCSRRLCTAALNSIWPYKQLLVACSYSSRRSLVSGRQVPTMPQAAASQAAGAEHKYTNRLAKEQSPYLLQHAHNPVEWYPWGEEAFEAARQQDKPIFLSVGYATCHWCHVMEHESFESEETAAIMNKHFINIKVDREERPDVDRVYMTFVQALTGGGGWPMSVWLTPGELQPFYGGTYYPGVDRYGMPSFPTVLRRIAQLWSTKRQDLREQVMAWLRGALAAWHTLTACGLVSWVLDTVNPAEGPVAAAAAAAG